jgi:hypothetical protein
VRGDGEFKSLEADISPIRLEIAPQDGHVPEVERSIQTVKSATRTLMHGLPFRRFPKILVLEMVYFTIRNLNLYPSENGVSKVLSPISIVTGEGTADYSSFGLEFGSYAQVYNDRPTTNSMAARTTDAIALCPAFNSTGGQYFLNLETGQRLLRHQYKGMTMPLSVIEQVEYLAKTEGQQRIKNKGLIFEYRPGRPVPDGVLQREAEERLLYGDDDDDEDFVPPTENDNNQIAPDDDLSVDSGIDDDELNNLGDVMTEEEEDHTPSPLTSADLQTYEELEDLVESVTTNPPITQTKTRTPTAEIHTEIEEEQTTTDEENRNEDYVSPQTTPIDDNEEKTPADTRYSLRNRDEINTPSFNHEFSNPANSKSYSTSVQMFQREAKKVKDNNLDCPAMHNAVTGVIFHQMSAKQGIKKFGQRAIDALFSEFAQLDDMEVFRGVMADSLSTEQKKGADGVKLN